jgi:DtxR family Mn-dependent transcriptional regulator
MELARRRELGRRALLEDLLKHVFTQRHEGREATVDSVAGHLELSAQRALAVIMKAESAGLLRSESGRLRLTEEGERWALQVVRAHRLWETWLADEARMPVAKLHKPAERQEHRLIAGARLDELDAYLGHPRSDPHGDPIPTAAGEIPEQAAQTLASWPSGKPARIVHVEDEPEEIFRTIMGHGLRPGITVQITDQTGERLSVTDGVNRYDLPPLVAGNIHVVSPPVAAAPERLVRLSDLKPGEEAQVVRIDPELRGFTRRRLLDLGLTPNSLIAARLTNAFGDPTAFQVRGTTIALRKDQASRIWVRKPAAAVEARVQ